MQAYMWWTEFWRLDIHRWELKVLRRKRERGRDCAVSGLTSLASNSVDSQSGWVYRAGVLWSIPLCACFTTLIFSTTSLHLTETNRSIISTVACLLSLHTTADILLILYLLTWYKYGDRPGHYLRPFAFNIHFLVSRTQKKVLRKLYIACGNGK